ncbi:hypothetical protein PICSAR240_04350 [Mycobacterium avium subsp. paratuberculosis]|nr:hypothetical protein B0172_00304 [Mycobacterium avium subsp. paratuberculosis]OVF04346.1 hypothetical protein B0173_01611 [Mycobacterium avium subsp. paratuberculosis]CAG6921233.1 hypothetical protein PICSAR10_03627 [Mycobacterium avium subsp. paratuberculosis]CAG6923944.1 hypothetical protein PICSAR118_03887 [Mycobacterium avium subsp. paratuberculosis]CAG6924510.1 hypothetical protein PICSAR104_03805 [Mycobacterium avium subsp. paratuberculosis]
MPGQTNGEPNHAYFVSWRTIVCRVHSPIRWRFNAFDPRRWGFGRITRRAPQQRAPRRVAAHRAPVRRVALCCMVFRKINCPPAPGTPMPRSRRHRITDARNSFHQTDSAAASFTGTARYPPCTPGSREFTDSNLPRPTASWVGGPLAKPWDTGTDSDTCIQIAAAPTDHDGTLVWTRQTDSKGNNNAAFACATALMPAANSAAEGNSLNSPADCQARACARARRSASVLTLARNRDSGSTICWASEASIRARIDRAPPATSRSIRSARSVRYSEAR